MGKKRIATVKGEEGIDKSQVAEKKKKKKARIVNRAKFHIHASYNNTVITLADENGGVIAWMSAGAAGFKGPRKATPYAATRVVELLMEKTERIDIKEAEIFVSGIGSGRDSTIRALTGKGLNIVAIKDVTPLPHNGCRPSRPRRV